MPNPWTVLGEFGLALQSAAMPDRGRYYPAPHVIVLRAGMPIVQQRAVLWHEIAHAERRDIPCLDAVLGRRQEAACWRRAARLAIPIRALLAALDWSYQEDEVADQLKVTVELLKIRVDSLHPSERAAVKRRLAAKEEVA